MSSFRWNRGGDFKGRKWDTDLPTDSSVSAGSGPAFQHWFGRWWPVGLLRNTKIILFALLRR